MSRSPDPAPRNSAEGSCRSSDAGRGGIQWISLFATALFLSADLKATLYGYVHWIVAAACIPAMALLGGRHFRLSLWHSFWALQFVIAVALAGLMGNCGQYSLIQALKLIGILVIGLNFYLYVPGVLNGAQRALSLCVAANVALFVGGLLISPVFSKQESIGRWGTILNWPGSLWKVGLGVIVLSLYRIVQISGARVNNVLLLAGGTLLVLVDGSRTALVLLAVAFGFTMLVLGMERIGAARVSQFSLLSLVGLVAAFTYFTPSVESSSVQFGAVARFGRLAQALVAGQGLSAVDPGRAEMATTAYRQVIESPIRGACINATTVMTSVGPMVVHQTYLQVWADLGILGITAYLALVLGWLLNLPNMWVLIQGEKDASRRAWYHNSVFLLLVFAASGLFHPLSTEWSEWSWFIVPASLLKNLYRQETEVDEREIHSA